MAMPSVIWKIGCIKLHLILWVHYRWPSWQSETMCHVLCGPAPSCLDAPRSSRRPLVRGPVCHLPCPDCSGSGQGAIMYAPLKAAGIRKRKLLLTSRNVLHLQSYKHFTRFVWPLPETRIWKERCLSSECPDPGCHRRTHKGTQVMAKRNRRSSSSSRKASLLQKFWTISINIWRH